MANDIVRAVRPLGFVWETVDPFLFCVHHEDFYPAGNEALGPNVPLDGRDLGQDFAGKDGFRMYHGEVVPGFPAHPHRGFETVTLVRRGYIDHADSLGAFARFGQGDVQWLTAGKGIVHAEMFPLLDREGPNTVELFQIWLNLPSKKKLAEPHFSMLWADQVPKLVTRDAHDRATALTLVSGAYAGVTPPAPPPDSWASQPGSDVAIWTLTLEPGATFELPRASAGVNRMLYLFRGTSARVAGREVSPKVGLLLDPEAPVALENGDSPAEFVLLQGKPIGEPVAQHGPFVMNTPAEIQQAFLDYRRTQFGGWPWSRPDPVHAREETRNAKHPDGRLDRPEGP